VNLRTNANWSQFLAASPALRDHSLTCLGAGEHSGVYRRFDGRRLASHALVIVSEGRGRYVDARHPSGRSIDAPSLVWLYPGIEHGYGPASGGWAEHWMLFSGRATLAYEQLGVWSRSNPIVELAAAPSAALALFGELRSALSGVGERNQLSASILCQRVIERASASASASAGDVGQRDLIAEFAAFAFTTMSVRERAQRLGLTVGQLRVAVARASGFTPLDYVVELRIARACELLVETTASVREISGDVGYDDPAYFTRLFTRRLGSAPTVFRDQQARSFDQAPTPE